MTGQGSPHPRWKAALRRCAEIALSLILVCAIDMPSTSAAAPPAWLPTRLFIRWGDAAAEPTHPARMWRGTITVSAGRWQGLDHLAYDMEAIGSVWLAEQVLHIETRHPLKFNALEVDVLAPPDAILKFDLAAADVERQQFDIPLRKLTTSRTYELLSPNELLSGRTDHVQRTLDQEGTELQVSVVGTEQIRIDPQRRALIFGPSETWTPKVSFSIPGLPPQQSIRIQAGFRNAEGKDLAETVVRRTLQTDAHGHLDPLTDLAVTLPTTEGSHYFFVELQRQGLTVRRSLLRRQFDVLVLSPDAPPEVAAEETPIESIDFAHPDWSQRVAKLPRIPLPGVKRDSAASRLEERNGRKWLILSGGATQAYPLTIDQTNLPHALDVTYSTELSQTLGIAILEAESDGSNPRILADSGVNVPSAGEFMSLVDAPRDGVHRILFWPQRENIWIILTNRQNEREASVGQATLVSFLQGLPTPAVPASSERLASYQLPRARITALWGEDTNDSWNEYYQAARQTIDYLHYRGYNSLILPLTEGGGTLFPSTTLPNLPRFDQSTITGDRQPMRKDIAELVFQLADRSGIRVIPMLSFEHPLPVLEQARHTLPQEEYMALLQSGAAHQEGHAEPILYNPLHPQVQQALEETLQEVVQRYGSHASFAGIMLECRSQGSTQLLDAESGMNSTIYSQFASKALPRSTISRVAWEEPQLLVGPQRARWIAWTCGQLSALHGRFAQIACPRPNTRLYLSLHDLMLAEGRHGDRDTSESISSAPTLAERGIDLSALAKSPNVVLLHSHNESTNRWLSTEPSSASLRSDTSWGTDDGERGLIFAHPDWPIEIAGLTARSSLTVPVAPFDLGLRHETNAPIQLHSSLVTPGLLARRQLIQAMAKHDWSIVVDRSTQWMQGDPAATRPWLEHYRALPLGPVGMASTSDEANSLPVIVRSWTRDSTSWLFAINDSPIAIRFKVGLRIPRAQASRIVQPSGSARFEADATRSDVVWWVTQISPYDLAKTELRVPHLTIVETVAEALSPTETQMRLKQRLGIVESRLTTLTEKVDFEDSPLDWSTDDPELVLIGAPDPASPRNHILQLQSTGSMARVTSGPLVVPPTGWLSIQGRLRAAFAETPPTLRMQVRWDGAPAPLERTIEVPIASTDWQKLPEVVWGGIPQHRTTPFRLTIELEGEGTVWLDDLEISGFTKRDRMSLSNVVIAASNHLRHMKLIECSKVLDGYLPRLVLAHTEGPIHVARQPAASPKSAPARKNAVGGWFRLTR